MTHLGRPFSPKVGTLILTSLLEDLVIMVVVGKHFTFCLLWFSGGNPH